MRRAVCIFCLLLSLSCSSAPPTTWRYWAADAGSTKYAPHDQISGTNFADLEIAWRYSPANVGSGPNRGTPIEVDGVLYYGSPMNVLCAIDAQSGTELWTFDPQVWKKPEGFLGNLRGIVYWSDGQHQRIFFGTASERLYAVDIKTGQPDPNFGQGGFVDLGQGLRLPVNRAHYGVTSAPIVCRNTVVVGAAINDWHGEPPPVSTSPGDIRGFDALTGRLLWTFHTVPQQGEYGTHTWENGAWKTHGQANVWAAMSADEELGYIYLPVSATTHNNYGGRRPGDNLFSQSLVCLDATTGTRIWHYQLVHHGLWNFDPPAAPVLLDINVDGRPIKAVAQVTKQALCYVFDRRTGTPVWPIAEVPVPQSNVPGEKTSPTQPLPSKPAAYDRRGLSADDLIDFTPQLRRQALDMLAPFDYGPAYTPPNEKGVISLPGGMGGSDWTGAAAHIPTNRLYVPSRTTPDWTLLVPFDDNYASNYARFDGPQGLPLTKPPYGRITAIDLNTGHHLWMRPTGQGPIRHPALKDLDVKDLGWHSFQFTAVTTNLLLVATPYPMDRGLPAEYFAESGSYLRALDLDDGRTLGQLALPGNAAGNPMSYSIEGRQYIVVPINRPDNQPELVALTLAVPSPP